MESIALLQIRCIPKHLSNKPVHSDANIPGDSGTVPNESDRPPRHRRVHNLFPNDGKQQDSAFHNLPLLLCRGNAPPTDEIGLYSRTWLPLRVVGQSSGLSRRHTCPVDFFA